MPSRRDDLALALADIADALSMASFRAAGLASHYKADGGIVTEVDLAVERALRDRLAAVRPGDAVLGEELGRRGSGDRQWTLDPIDGTASFAKGRTEWATLVALVHGGLPVVGVVSKPVDGRRWWAAQGEGAFANGRAMRVSSTERLSDATVCEDFRVSIGRELTSNPLPRFARACGAVHRWVDRFDFMGIADGEVDVILNWHAGSGPDLNGQVAIVMEAGGRFSDLDGRIDTDAFVYVVSNGHVHGEALANELVASEGFDALTPPVEDIPEILRARTRQPGSREVPSSSTGAGPPSAGRKAGC